MIFLKVKTIFNRKGSWQLQFIIIVFSLTFITMHSSEEITLFFKKISVVRWLSQHFFIFYFYSSYLFKNPITHCSDNKNNIIKIYYKLRLIITKKIIKKIFKKLHVFLNPVFLKNISKSFPIKYFLMYQL